MSALKKSGYAPVNGISMYFELHGEGDIPLVLIHGGGSTLDSTFGRLLPILAKNHQVIAVELQAHGRTSDRDAPESFEQDADDVAALLGYLNINKANILGFSNGGSTTLQIAIRHPQLVNKIVVITGAYKRDGFMEGFFDFMPHATPGNMPALLHEAFLKVNPDSNKLQTMFEKDKARMVSFTDFNEDDMKAIKAAALFMVSSQDVVTLAHTAHMAHLVDNAELIVLPGVHGGFIGAAEAELKPGSKMPEITAALINEFLG
ncbi:alpha/beta hydrolase [Mucilaginibacter sp. dw_454]|uniref:alpha/beta fold hydrolase n=1 Tax=Mucilaginibacter sp. dw_454 TaxID=2720079 RepID=UPI001BD4C06D|nr:alpha/beta hydrolase [Mucilaginibacter sp. dw_454]